ncbi:MAG: DUF5667 domain-containing protein [Candidatus Dormibacteraeota bacterium]|nr:DUF5667 domain-containing protein [Candidatus Dormibacteraeota bacterium]
MISENQRLERLAERLRAVDPLVPSPAVKIRAWNLISAQVQKPATARLKARSTGRFVLAGMAAAALLVAGTVAAAADSLPDSALYPVKGTIEAIEGRLVFSPQDQFNYHLSLAHTRLREAEAMFARHRIDLADEALAGLQKQLTDASGAVAEIRATDSVAADSLQRQLAQAVQTHDNQLAGLQGEVTNPTALSAITQARNKAQQAVLAAGVPAGHGAGNPNDTPPAKSSGQDTPGGPANTPRPSHKP